jgi:Flp pilus assembly protein TadD
VRDAELAVERAETAIHLEGHDDSLSFDTLAAAQANSGDFAAATATLQQAIAIAPEDERGVYQARLMLYRSGRAFRIAPVRPVALAAFEQEN